MKPKRLSRTTVYQSEWINLHVDKVELPSGSVLDQYHVLDFPTEAVAVVVTNASGQILMVHAYRYATQSEGWEVPAGRIEQDEDVLEAARREVLEEAGHETKSHTHVHCFHPDNGMSNHRVNIVTCEATTETGHFDRDEVQEYRWLSTDEVLEMVSQGEITDGVTLVSLLLVVANHQASRRL